jgi:PhnB protein
MKNWKPAGYNSVAPYLVVSGAQQVIDFLKAGLAATELRRFDTPEGRIMHAEVRVDDSVVMIADAAENWPAIACHLHVYVPDVDEAYRKCLAAGGVAVQEPKKADDPDKRGGVRDPAGNTWWVATQLTG